MAKDKLTEYDATAANNTVVGDVNLAENSALPSDMNNAVREVMSHQKEAFGSGTPLYVDQTNNRVGIGNSAPSTALEVDAAGATVLTVDRASSEGTVVDLQKDGTTFGTLGIDGSDLVIDGPSGHTGLRMTTSGLLPRQNGAIIDNTIDLGSGAYRYNDLYLGGGAYIGGTGSSNFLDDYEEGTFTPRFQLGLTSPGYSVQSGTYVKVGSLVVCSVYLRANSGTENGDHIYVGGLPFTVMSIGGNSQYGAFFSYNGGFWNSDVNTQWLALDNQTNLAFYRQSDGAAIQGTTSGVATNLNADLRLVAVYRS